MLFFVIHRKYFEELGNELSLGGFFIIKNGNIIVIFKSISLFLNPFLLRVTAVHDLAPIFSCKRALFLFRLFL